MTVNSKRQKALIIAYPYPPIVSAGSEPLIRFVQHLPEFGYDPLVLTTDRYGALSTDAASRVYRAPDLAHQVLGFVRRRKIRGIPQEQQPWVPTFANQSWAGKLRDAVMVPDTKIGWFWPAVRLGMHLIKQYQPAVVFSSSPPETSHLIAGDIAHRTGLPWVADLRDGWLFEPPDPSLRQSVWRRWIEGRMERAIALQAAAITAASPHTIDDLEKRYPTTIGKTRNISNGYEEDEFTGLEPQRNDTAFLLVHTGGISASHTNATPALFFSALSILRSARPDLQLKVQIVGNLAPREKVMAMELNLADTVEFLPLAPRREAHQRQINADALLLITPAGKLSLASLKLFDYIGAGKPVLALAENNTPADIVNRYGLGITVPPTDPVAIAWAIEEIARRVRAGEAWPGFASARKDFQWRVVTRQLAEVFDSVVLRGGQ